MDTVFSAAPPVARPCHERPPCSPFAWGVAQRLGVVAVLVTGLWLAVAVALDWVGWPA
ncbi:MAG: hypothetical protein HQL80_00825 [Magnetococcales bacterium]|nr:hypothetical protein [Magnetococcales bacterium]